MDLHAPDDVTPGPALLVLVHHRDGYCFDVSTPAALTRDGGHDQQRTLQQP